MKLILITFSVFAAAIAHSQCDSSAYEVSGKLSTNTSRTVEVMLDDRNGMIPGPGQIVNLNKHFESNLFGFKSTGWLDIAKAEAIEYDEQNNKVKLKVLEEHSEMTINGSKKNHFERGNIVKMSWKTAPIIEQKFEVIDNDTLARGELLCGYRHGIWRYYYRNGQLQEQDNYYMGKPDGEYTAWYEGGEIKETGSYDKGERNGAMTLYYISGQPKKIVNYKGGMKDGAYLKTEAVNTKLLMLKMSSTDHSVFTMKTAPSKKKERINTEKWKVL